MAVVGASAGGEGLAIPRGLWVPCSSLPVPPAVSERAQTLSLALRHSPWLPISVTMVRSRSLRW